MGCWLWLCAEDAVQDRYTRLFVSHYDGSSAFVRSVLVTGLWRNQTLDSDWSWDCELIVFVIVVVNALCTSNYQCNCKLLEILHSGLCYV